MASLALADRRRQRVSHSRLPRHFLIGAALLAVVLGLTTIGSLRPGSKAYATCSTTPGVPVVVTDKPDYFPGSIVRIDGCGFNAFIGQTLPLIITYPNALVFSKSAVVDSSGS